MTLTNVHPRIAPLQAIISLTRCRIKTESNDMHWPMGLSPSDQCMSFDFVYPTACQRYYCLQYCGLFVDARLSTSYRPNSPLSLVSYCMPLRRQQFSEHIKAKHGDDQLQLKCLYTVICILMSLRRISDTAKMLARTLQALSDPCCQSVSLCACNFDAKCLAIQGVRVQQGAYRKVIMARRLVTSSMSSRDYDVLLVTSQSLNSSHSETRTSARASRQFENTFLRFSNPKKRDFSVFTARCTLVQSAVLPSHVVCLSVCLSVCL